MGATAAAATAGGGALLGFKAQQEQDIANRRRISAQKKAAAVERRLAEITNQRERSRVIQDTRAAQALNLASAQASGALGTSALAGVQAGLQSTLSEAIGFQNTQLAANAAQTRALQRGEDQFASHMKTAGRYQAAQGLIQSASSVFLPS